ncbi:MAG: hypothetical protein D6B28_02795 [Gammaproteobacteria bacterium]|nr:MAG: hypothetical protein D6B28_02795 [Gammaproteobacteria bacterium]
MGKPGARIGDMHTCPMVDPGPKPHVGGPVSKGNPTVLSGGIPLATIGDMCVCCGPPDTIAQGEPTVLAGKKPVATISNSMSHGGVIAAGLPTVLFGSDNAVAAASVAAVALGPTCKYCKKPVKKKDEHLVKPKGDAKGESDTLTDNIVAASGIGKIENHPWFYRPVGKKRRSIQAHHLICSKVLDKEDNSEWATTAEDFGYDINCAENGTMIPAYWDLACCLSVPVHNTKHDKGHGDTEDISYPDAVRDLIKPLMTRAKRGKFCGTNAFAKLMNTKSLEIFQLISDFTWTISENGKDFQPNDNGKVGCRGFRQKTTNGKNNELLAKCPFNGKHTTENLVGEDDMDEIKAKYKEISISGKLTYRG